MVHNKPTTVRLELHAQQLKNVAGAFKGVSGTFLMFLRLGNSNLFFRFHISDPFAVVTLLSNNPNEQPRIIGKTEVMKNTLSPRWTTKFDIDYEFGTNARINIGVWDEVRKGNNKPMGSAVFEVGAILGSKGNTKAKKLRQGGTLFCRITPAPPNTGTVQFALKGNNLKNTDGFFGKSDPFFEVSARISTAGGMTWQAVYRSKPIMNNLSPVWDPATIELGRFGGDVNAPILIEVWDWTKDGKHNPMGKFECTVGALVSAAGHSTGFTLLRNKKPFGTILVQSASIEGAPEETNGRVVSGTAPVPVALPSFSNLSMQEQAPMPPPMAPPPPVKFSAAPEPKPHRFVDYLAGGLELELSIAIDFTGSNGDPRIPGTLHYIHPNGELNDYEKAITAVGGIIAQYDSDQKFPVLGFGAKYGGVVQHCFQVGNAPELNGLDGVLQAYRNVFATGLTMSGPTVFSEIIDYTAATARSRHESLQQIGKQAYKVLLIVTDGAVTDVERTKQSIQNAANAPMSIVIVGVGGADFQAMRFLDDFMGQPDQDRRDICQFVEFSRHANNRQSLTSATLEEIPDQLVQFYQIRGIRPLPPVSGSQMSLVPDDYNDEDIDLSVDIAADGEMSLVNTHGAVYDDTKYNTFAEYSGITPLAAPVVVPARMFQVQVPDGVAPGGQLQVTNPMTGQIMVVTVPPGVAPGSRFNVQY